MNALILGSKSDIATAIKPMLEADGYTVAGWSRGRWPSHPERWDLLVITIGMVKPVGLWHDVSQEMWAECLYSNLTLPFQLLRRVWGYHNPNATVIWFAGSNPQKIMDGYSAYNTAVRPRNSRLSSNSIRTRLC
jgi:NAD(P)-dependent dehydrogenase (short-subunit alcohol dehydrogenase family)